MVDIRNRELTTSAPSLINSIKAPTALTEEKESKQVKDQTMVATANPMMKYVPLQIL